jgi:hypothetical protein
MNNFSRKLEWFLPFLGAFVATIAFLAHFSEEIRKVGAGDLTPILLVLIISLCFAYGVERLVSVDNLNKRLSGIEKLMSDLNSHVNQNPTTALRHATLNKCFDTIEGSLKHVRHLRIYGNATTNIEPVLANSGITVDRCEVLIRESHLDESDDENFDRHIGHMLKQWHELERKARIKELVFGRHDTVPTEWQIIFDDKFIICGLNIPGESDWLGIDILEPILVDDRSVETKLLISKYIQRFDGFFKARSDRSPKNRSQGSLSGASSQIPTIAGHWEYEVVTNDGEVSHKGDCDIDQRGRHIRISGIRKLTRDIKDHQRVYKPAEAAWASDWAEICDDNFLRFDYHITVPHPKRGGIRIEAMCRVNLPLASSVEMTGRYYMLPPIEKEVLNCPFGTIVFRLLPDGAKLPPPPGNECGPID